jgi:hypothetical protein
MGQISLYHLKLCGTEPEDYEGGRTAGDIVRWAEEKAAENVPAPEVKQITGVYSKVNDIETKVKTFRYRSFLSEQKQNVFIWSTYYRNESRMFQSVPKLFKIKVERKQNETELIYYRYRIETFPHT